MLGCQTRAWMHICALSLNQPLCSVPFLLVAPGTAAVTPAHVMRWHLHRARPMCFSLELLWCVPPPPFLQMAPRERAWSVEKSDSPDWNRGFLSFTAYMHPLIQLPGISPLCLCLCGFPPLRASLSFLVRFNSSHIQLKEGQNEILKSKPVSSKLIKYWYRTGIAEIAQHMYFILPPHTQYFKHHFFKIWTPLDFAPAFLCHNPHHSLLYSTPPLLHEFTLPVLNSKAFPVCLP